MDTDDTDDDDVLMENADETTTATGDNDNNNPTRLTSSSCVEDHIDVYLKKPPYLGRSSWPNREAVKDAGARWDRVAKKWYATNKDTLVELLQTRKWTPDSLASAEQMLTILEQRREAERKAEHAKACAERKRVGPTEAESESYIARDLGIPKSTAAEIEALAPWKITPEQLELSAKEPRIGPRSGFSTAARLHMGLSRGLITADQIGVPPPPRRSRARSEQEGTAQRSRKLPTLPRFGKTSFSAPSGTSGQETIFITSLRATPLQSAYDEEHAVEYGEYDPDEQVQMYDTCSICCEDYLLQFPCECVDVARVFGY